MPKSASAWSRNRRVVELLTCGEITIGRREPGIGRRKDRHGRTLATIEVASKDMGEISLKASPGHGRANRHPWSERR